MQYKAAYANYSSRTETYVMEKVCMWRVLLDEQEFSKRTGLGKGECG